MERRLSLPICIFLFVVFFFLFFLSVSQWMQFNSKQICLGYWEWWQREMTYCTNCMCPSRDIGEVKFTISSFSPVPGLQQVHKTTATHFPIYCSDYMLLKKSFISTWMCINRFIYMCMYCNHRQLLSLLLIE